MQGVSGTTDALASATDALSTGWAAMFSSSPMPEQQQQQQQQPQPQQPLAPASVLAASDASAGSIDPLGSGAGESGSAAPGKKLVKKKLVRKIIRKPSDMADGSAAAGGLGSPAESIGLSSPHRDAPLPPAPLAASKQQQQQQEQEQEQQKAQQPMDAEIFNSKFLSKDYALGDTAAVEIAAASMARSGTVAREAAGDRSGAAATATEVLDGASPAKGANGLPQQQEALTLPPQAGEQQQQQHQQAGLGASEEMQHQSDEQQLDPELFVGRHAEPGQPARQLKLGATRHAGAGRDGEALPSGLEAADALAGGINRVHAEPAGLPASLFAIADAPQARIMPADGTAGAGPPPPPEQQEELQEQEQQQQQLPVAAGPGEVAAGSSHDGHQLGERQQTPAKQQPEGLHHQCMQDQRKQQHQQARQQQHQQPTDEQAVSDWHGLAEGSGSSQAVASAAQESPGFAPAAAAALERLHVESGNLQHGLQAQGQQPCGPPLGQQQHQQREEQQSGSPRQQQQQQQRQRPASDPSGLRQAVEAREGQLVRQAAQLAAQQLEVEQLRHERDELSARLAAQEEIVVQLSRKNEQLVLRSAKVSEEEMAAVQAEFQARIAALEKKASMLTKERDALKQSGRASSASEAALKAKDDLAQELMAEGEKLSKRVLDLEGQVKRARAHLREESAEKEKLAAQLAAEQAECEAQRRARAAAERDLAAAMEAARQELEAAQKQAEADLQKARSEQMEAEALAREAAQKGAAKRAQQAEAHAAALVETVQELREALERQRAAANLREEMMKQVGVAGGGWGWLVGGCGTWPTWSAAARRQKSATTT
ncbi:hypothetical protein MNEG_8043 [Monoraphidium neglectum]|uniref:Uncharacterized protein n=1 Tax=Monoraphidium neglectum TaxID=145388 RepID=A0A0D2MGT5_9CHLO|nr:hypothetical protein MNEG_8043 [Monoraphidium neglectum]KIY99916.1 hypothetical protein MNEG_8043 [Monoraphidium neglectum]|eukprot:XP_013898936.1 hypothetical protein MNEG_8043 [Monoraphidium neglectum]